MAFSRRELLKMTGGALGASALVSRFSMMSALAQTTGPDYKALVCIYLHGGNDAINTVVPYEQNEYNYYAATRPTIALPRTSATAGAAVLPLAPPITPLANGRAFALHPSMTDLQTLWGSQKLAILCNVGTLTEPLTPTTYRNKSASHPVSLFDHNLQQNEWQGFGTNGWGQTIGRALASLNTGPRLPMLLNVSHGSNLFLAGTQPYITLTSGATLDVTGFSSSSASTARYNALRQMQKLQTDSALVHVLGNTVSDSIDSAHIASAALGAANIKTVFPKTDIGNQLLQIAKIISIRSQLGHNARQVFYADMGGFDTHDNQLADQSKLLGQLSQAMSAFYAATQELQVSSGVTQFTLSEFGRTMQNAKAGSDHAWGSVGFILGDSVKGGDFYGQYPSLTLGGANDADTGSGARGRFVPTTAVDQYAGTLGKWFGLSDTALSMALPNLTRFAPTDVGFMKS